MTMIALHIATRRQDGCVVQVLGADRLKTKHKGACSVQDGSGYRVEHEMALCSCVQVMVPYVIDLTALCTLSVAAVSC